MTSLATLNLPVQTARHRIEPGEDGIRIVRLAGARTVGTLHLAIAGSELDLLRVCVDDDARGYGAGTDAVRLVLAAATPACRVATAFAPPENGLAVYFWTRMGFRPRFGKHPRGLCFERELS